MIVLKSHIMWTLLSIIVPVARKIYGGFLYRIFLLLWIFWERGKCHGADYFTKHHLAPYHKLIKQNIFWQCIIFLLMIPTSPTMYSTCEGVLEFPSSMYISTYNIKCQTIACYFYCYLYFSRTIIVGCLISVYN